MAQEFSWVNSLISAGAGLGGVWLGGWLTSRREARKERDRIQRETCYLAALAVAHLNRFANGCLVVALDDGTSGGRPAGDGEQLYQTTVVPPVFEPLDLDVDWKVLPASLMVEVLQLSFRCQNLESSLAAIWQFDDPPDYCDFFWSRQERYAELGLEVSDLVHRLQKFAGLPVPQISPGEWNRDQALRDRRDKVCVERREFEKRVAHSLVMPHARVQATTANCTDAGTGEGHYQVRI